MTQGLPQVAQAAVEKTSKPMRLLIVDDEESIRTMIASALIWKKKNCTIFEAESAIQARAILERENYAMDAILLDLNMPEVRGEQFLEWVKLVAPEIAVVILTGSRTDETLMRCLRNGANDFLEKPCTVDRVCETVERAIEHQGRISTKQGISAETPTQGWVELTAPSEIEYLSRVQAFSDVLFQSRLSKEVCEDLRLAIEELGRNAIEWGNRFDTRKKFSIAYAIFDDRIVLKVEDEGEGFNPDDVPDPSKDPLAHLQRRKAEGKRPGGYGVYLLRNMFDEIVYSKKGNVCVMTKFLPPKEAS